MYALDAGYHVADRMAFFEKMGAELRRLQLLILADRGLFLPTAPADFASVGVHIGWVL
jgi:hypothetical protein